MAAELLANPNISAEVESRLADVHMSAEEALELLADIARGDMAQMMDVSSVGFNMDMAKAKEAGLTKLIKKVKQRTTTFIAKKESEEDREVTELEVELYSAHEAVRDVLKIHGRFTEHLDIKSGGKQIKGYTVVTPDDWKDDDSDGS
jgi:3-deoxy-D-arabino-heptulosonate 7-phosphate (DAHP) synthase class II